jgi:hypothetical protein
MSWRVAVYAIIALWFDPFVSFSQKRCMVDGDWEVISGKLSSNSVPYDTNEGDRVSFQGDSVTVGSGFFFKSFDVESNSYPGGCYPYVYYGNRELFKFSGDSLHIRSTPYAAWNSFKISCKTFDEIVLTGANCETVLHRTKKITEKKCELKRIKVVVLNGELYLFNYEISIDNTDSIHFDELARSTTKKRGRYYGGVGYFDRMCRSLTDVNLIEFDGLYRERIPGVLIEIELKNGQIFRKEVVPNEGSNKLRSVLTPIIYSFQRFDGSRNLKPIK